MHCWANRWTTVILLAMIAGAFACGWSQSTAQSATPTHDQKSTHADGAKIDWNAALPSAAELKDRVLKNLKQSEAEQERYICKTIREEDDTDKNGNVKQRHIRQYDMFFVNGQEIDELTGKDGKTLSVDQKNKEMERVQKEIKKDSDAKYIAKQDAQDDKQLDMLLRMLRYTNGHRVDRGGRSTLAYDLSGDPSVHPKGVEETFLHDMSGTIEVDERTGELVDLNARLDHDVKIGGGLLADLHKGFWLHVRQQRYPDGVWLPELVEGNGDARAALFFHPYFKFKQTMDGCALTSVTTSQGASSIAK
ncbi:MAG TPA: hypothetical protein VMF56_13775 [Acidobacteriaceae bacterium]|nr:hypothetical protein [Acidobacteriaceae bacterium]